MNKRCSKVILPVLAATTVVLHLFGCGKKAPPVPPQYVPPPAVNDLTESIVGDFLELTWTYSVDKKKGNSGVSGFIVYRSQEKLSEPVCEDCPITFERAQDIPIEIRDAEKVITSVMTYKEILEKGFRYRYKITVYTDKGVVGSDSNIVEFEH